MNREKAASFKEAAFLFLFQFLYIINGSFFRKIRNVLPLSLNTRTDFFCMKSSMVELFIFYYPFRKSATTPSALKLNKHFNGFAAHLCFNGILQPLYREPVCDDGHKVKLP